MFLFCMVMKNIVYYSSRKYLPGLIEFSGLGLTSLVKRFLSRNTPLLSNVMHYLTNCTNWMWKSFNVLLKLMKAVKLFPDFSAFLYVSEHNFWTETPISIKLIIKVIYKQRITNVFMRDRGIGSRGEAVTITENNPTYLIIKEM